MTSVDDYQSENTSFTLWGILPEEVVAMFVLGTLVTLGILLVLVSAEIIIDGLADARELLWIGLTALLAVSGFSMLCCVAVFLVLDCRQSS